LKVILGTLKQKGEELVKFLEPRVGTKPSLSDDSVEIDDGSVRKGVRPRQVKTYIKRFLYINDLRKNYRVFVHGRELTVQELELGEKEEEEMEKVKEKMEKAEKEATEEREAKEPAKPGEKEETKTEPPKAPPKKGKKSRASPKGKAK